MNEYAILEQRRRALEEIFNFEEGTLDEWADEDINAEYYLQFQQD